MYAYPEIFSKPLSLLGCGPLSVEVAEYYIKICLQFNQIPSIHSLVDYNHPESSSSVILQLLRSYNLNLPNLSVSFREISCEESNFLVTVASSSSVRHRLFEELSQTGFTLPILVHPSSTVSPLARLSPGCILAHRVVVGHNASLSPNVFVNNDSVVAHDSFLGHSTIVSPRVNISGYTTIEDDCMLYTGCVTANNAHLHKGSVISALSFYTKTRGNPYSLYMGNPARCVRNLLN
tara:strand:+ start:17404 stop:18108 length:705 start_codon:yes stop_codon:yes gene_type:complete